MIRKRVEVEELTSAEVERLITRAVHEVVGPLQRAVQDLREQLHRHRRVITYKEAPAYFSYDVQPEAIIRYIKQEGLPAMLQGRLHLGGGIVCLAAQAPQSQLTIA